MNTRRIGTLEVSVVGVGCNSFGKRIDARDALSVVDAALDASINFFDTADVYARGQSEHLLGRALGNRRRGVVIATKFGKEFDPRHRGARPGYVRRACEHSLRRLGTDYIDLFQLHEPDPTVPIAETLGALQELVTVGKVRQIGCCNVTPPLLRDARAAARPALAHFASVQNEYNLLYRHAEEAVLPECERQGIAFIPYYPLARGLLTGKYRRGRPAPQGSHLTGGAAARELLTDQNLAIVEDLIRFAASRGRTILELSISWLLTMRSVASVIAGATTAEQVQQNAASASWRLTTAELDEIDRIVLQTH